ncbi:MAG: hypothetical protein IKO01_09535 [Kiritimatiellae bacterium]|nr:hypothetical protein [Kiritimatiellia bacterium]
MDVADEIERKEGRPLPAPGGDGRAGRVAHFVVDGGRGFGEDGRKVGKECGPDGVIERTFGNTQLMSSAFCMETSLQLNRQTIHPNGTCKTSAQQARLFSCFSEGPSDEPNCWTLERGIFVVGGKPI